MIGDIENAIIKRIIDASGNAPGKLGYGFKKVETYGGEFADGFDRIVKLLPAVLIIYDGSKVNRDNDPYYDLTATFRIIIGGQSLRNEKDARQGSTNKVGTYQMVRDIQRLLSGQTFGLPIKPMRPLGDRSLYQDKSDRGLVSLYGLDFSVDYTETRYSDPDIADNSAEFRQFHANWDFPPFHEKQTPPIIPDDENADATDHVTLETE